MFHFIIFFVCTLCGFAVNAASVSTYSSGSTSVESFTYVDSQKSIASNSSLERVSSAKKTAAAGAGSPIFPAKSISAEPAIRPVDSFSPAQFNLTPRVTSLMEGVDLTPEAILEMLRPTPENPEAFVISAKLYNTDGSPNPEAIRVIVGGADKKGGSTDALFLVQVNTNFLRHKVGMPLTAAAGKVGLHFLRELSDAHWQTKLVVKVLKSIGTRRDGLRKVSLESVAREQIRNLERVKSSKVARINYFINPSLPRMTFDEASYYYVDRLGDKHYFSILHGAKGMPFSAIWQDYKEKRLDASKFQESAAAIGKALGAFHVYNRKPKIISSPNDFGSLETIVHGDFNWQNVFYDFEEKRVYFIDNESMARSFDLPQYIETDFLHFYSHQLFASYPNAKECCINKFSHEDLKILYKAFFQGYIGAYPKAIQPQLITYIKQVVSDFNEMMKGVVLPQEPLSMAAGAATDLPLTEGEIKLRHLFEGIFSF